MAAANVLKVYELYSGKVFWQNLWLKTQLLKIIGIKCHMSVNILFYTMAKVSTTLILSTHNSPVLHIIITNLLLWNKFYHKNSFSACRLIFVSWLKIHLTIIRGWGPIIRFNTTTLLTLSQARTWISYPKCCGLYFVFNNLR